MGSWYFLSYFSSLIFLFYLHGSFSNEIITSEVQKSEISINILKIYYTKNILKTNAPIVLKSCLFFLAENIPQIRFECKYNFHTSKTSFSGKQPYFIEYNLLTLNMTPQFLRLNSLSSGSLVVISL